MKNNEFLCKCSMQYSLIQTFYDDIAYHRLVIFIIDLFIDFQNITRFSFSGLGSCLPALSQVSFPASHTGNISLS